MTVLKNQVQLMLEAQGRSQKQLAMELAEVDDGGLRSPSTIEKNLALMWSNDEAALRFFFDSSERLARLAKELGVGVDQLEKWRSAPTLVLGPGLPEAFLSFVRDSETSENFTRFEVDSRWSSKEELRDAALADPNALLVLSADSQIQFGEFLSGAGVIGQLRRAKPVPRGWSIMSHEHLLKIPPPRQPVFFSKCGAPLFRLPNGTKRFDSREEEILCTLDELNTLTKSELTWEHGSLWSWQAPTIEPAVLLPHAPPRLVEPEFLEIVEGRNPVEFNEQSLRALVTSRGVHFDPRALAWIGGGAEWNAKAKLSKRLAERPLPSTLRLCGQVEEARVRGLLDGLLAREWAVAPTTELASQLALIHEWRAVAAADWVMVETRASQWEVTANLGAGRLAAVILWHFEKEASHLVQLPSLGTLPPEQFGGLFRGDERWINGGDVLACRVDGYSETLEGAVLRPRERREEARRRSYDD